MKLASALIGSMMALQADKPVTVGQIERDLTGDGEPEILRLVGVGPTMDNLSVTFVIESAGRTIYRFQLAPLTRGAGVLAAEDPRARIKDYERWFFGEEKFQRPEEFVDSLRVQARERALQIADVIASDRQASDTVAGRVIWDEIRNAPVTIFTFSPGGDAIVAIGWNARAGRFYRLLDCC